MWFVVTCILCYGLLLIRGNFALYKTVVYWEREALVLPTQTQGKTMPVCHEMKIYQRLPPLQTGTQRRHLRERKAITSQTIADHASLAIGGCFIFIFAIQKNSPLNITKTRFYISLCRIDPKCVNLFSAFPAARNWRLGIEIILSFQFTVKPKILPVT